MTIDKLKSMKIAICEAPGGKGFCIEHMPDFLESDDFDDTAPHVHYFYEIIWFKEGRGSHSIDFQEYDIEPNTIIFLSPGQVHHFDKTADYKGISIKMNTEFMRSEGDANKIFMKYNAFHTFDTTPCVHIDGATALMLDKLVEEMEDEMRRSDEFGNLDILKSLLRIFLVKVLRYGNQEHNLDNMKPSHMLFVRFRRMVEQEYMHLHTVQEYADRLNVAVRTLNKCTNECTQLSPLAFINKRIVLEAKRMIRYTNLMIKEIAFTLGYEDVSSFVKLFKRETGYHPTEFREIEQ